MRPQGVPRGPASDFVACRCFGKGGPHRVEGIVVGFEPPFLDRSRLHDIRAIDQDRAFEMCRRLAREAGIFAGGSTGLNVVAAIELAVELGPGTRVVTSGCDNGSKYLGGPIFRTSTSDRGSGFSRPCAPPAA